LSEIKKVFFRSFLLFFFIQIVLIFIIDYKIYKEEIFVLHNNIKTDMELCSLTLKSDKYKITFQKKEKNRRPFKLYFDKKGNVYMFFEILDSDKYYLKITLPKEKYLLRKKNIFYNVLDMFVFHVLLIVITSFIFSFLMIIPIKKAYKINEIFIKDILHDYNTPLSALKMNLFLLKKTKDEKLIEKIEKNIGVILNLQKNLQIFIDTPNIKKTEFNVKTVVEEKLNFYTNIYYNIKTQQKLQDLYVISDVFLFERIIDNILSNAFKYCARNGYVKVLIQNNGIIISNSGKIKNPNEIFRRFYKENERGVGIGLDIVKRYSRMLNIDINLKIENGEVAFILDLSKIRSG